MKCEQKFTINTYNNSDEDAESDNGLAINFSGIESGDCTKEAISLYTSQLAIRPTHAMARWRHSLTRNRRLPVSVELPTETVFLPSQKII